MQSGMAFMITQLMQSLGIDKNRVEDALNFVQVKLPQTVQQISAQFSAIQQEQQVQREMLQQILQLLRESQSDIASASDTLSIYERSMQLAHGEP